MSNLTMKEGKHDQIRVSDGSEKDSIYVTRKKTVYVPSVEKARVRFRNNLVYLFLDDLPIEMTTPMACKLGLQLAIHGEWAFWMKEIVLLVINGKEIYLLPEVARQIGGVMLKKADRSDDWQKKLVHICG